MAGAERTAGSSRRLATTTARVAVQPSNPRGALLGTDGSPWWESYFDEGHDLLYPDKDEASGDADVRSILAALAIRAGARILDVGCGNGRHAVPLARRGYRVTAVDRSPRLLEKATEAKDRAGVDVEFRLADMRTLPLLGAPLYDAVLSVFTSFGYFSDEENEGVARGMAACLAPGGRLLVDLNNGLLLEKAHGVRTWSERPGGFLLDEFRFEPDTRRFGGNRIVLVDGEEKRFPFDHRAYSEAEIRGLLRRVGLRVLSVYGSLDRTPFNENSPRMVVLAEKP